MRALVIACAMLCATALPTQVMPRLGAETLAGQRIVLPHELAAVSVLVAGYTKESRKQTEPWVRRLREEARIAGKATVYEVAILDGVPSFIRGMILRQMRSGVSAARQKEYLVVTENVETWRSLLGPTGDDDACILLMRTNGVVLWRTHGPVNDGAFEALIRNGLSSSGAP